MTSELTWLWVKRRPYVQEALERGIVNYSALARIANKEIKGSEAAVKAALIRTGRKLRKSRVEAEAKVRAILRNSELEVKAKVVTVVSEQMVENAIASAKGPSGWMNVIEESKALGIKGKIERHLDLIAITSPKEIEKVTGVVAYIMQKLAAENINILHMVSASTDTLLVIRDVDTPQAFKVLSEIVKG
jgi:aspartokinase